jgi:hypothetical protein
MNDQVIVTMYVVIDDVLKAWQHQEHRLVQVRDAEILTMALVAYFQNHQERAVGVMQRAGYVSRRVSISRYNRRLHRLRPWPEALATVLSELLRQGELFIIDSLPLPVCHRRRASVCGKVRGSPYYGRCPAKDERFFGWRLHLIYTLEGIPVAFELIPGRYHDLTAIHELTFVLPTGARVLADKGYNCWMEEASILADTGVRLIPSRKKNMRPHAWADDYDLRQYRQRAETFNS